MSKEISKHIKNLQKANFQWEDTNDYIGLIKKYCRKSDTKIGKSVELDGRYYIGCVADILWWCDFTGETPWGHRVNTNQFGISGRKYLKEFLVANPPKFKISSECCNYAKKKLAHRVEKEINADLKVTGIRKAEGGIRSKIYKNCYSTNNSSLDLYMPIFWYKEKDKRDYEKYFEIKHSDCYEVWGFPRTGCAGCPYANKLEYELEATRLYEPKLYKAIMNIFSKSYQYTKEYNDFVLEMKRKEKGHKELFDMRK